MTDTTLGQRIGECRKREGLSQEALGDKLGVSRQAISKWEADGAVPEVDKLIGMSKVFGVSVGWLLGIEEETAPEQKPEISEELLRKIEEIVLRYRPRKQPMSVKKKVLLALAAALALWLGTTLYSRLSVESSTLAFTYGQVQNINEQNAIIQNQLASLTSQLNALTQAEANQAALLSDYSFLLDVWTDRPGANVTFSAVPKSWTETDYAYIVVQVPDGTSIRQDCAWDGAFLTAPIVLEAVDGYKLCFAVVHGDGTMEQQILSDNTLNNLARELTVVCDVTWGEGELSCKTGELELNLHNYDIHIARPGIVASQEGYYWKSVTATLYRNTTRGQETVGVIDLLEYEDEIRESFTVWFTPSISFTIPEIADGDGLELWVRAELSNGMYAMEMAGSWAYHNGELIASVPVA